PFASSCFPLHLLSSLYISFLPLHLTLFSLHLSHPLSASSVAPSVLYLSVAVLYFFYCILFCVASLSFHLVSGLHILFLCLLLLRLWLAPFNNFCASGLHTLMLRILSGLHLACLACL